MEPHFLVDGGRETSFNLVLLFGSRGCSVLIKVDQVFKFKEPAQFLYANNYNITKGQTVSNMLSLFILIYTPYIRAMGMVVFALPIDDQLVLK